MTLKREASVLTKFRILMWKNFLQFLRNPVNSASDVVLPILCMGLVLSVRALMPNFPMNASIYRPISAYRIDHPLTVSLVGSMNFTHLTLAYSPTNPILEEVLKQSLITLERFNNNRFIRISDINIEGYDQSNDLQYIFATEESTLRIIAAVQFDDSLSGITELPEDVSYSLRFPQRLRLHFSVFSRTWRTHETFPSFPRPGPRERFNNEGGFDPGYVLEMFTGFQHAISMELIKQLTHVESLDDFVVNLQRYPHPAFVENNFISTTDFLIPMMLMISVIFPLGNAVKAIVLEKELQLKETMMIMGLSSAVQWVAWFFRWFIYFLILAVVFVLLLKIHFFSDESGTFAMLTNTPWTIVFVFLLVYFTATVCFLFLISTLFAKADTAAMFVGLIWFLLYMPSLLLLMDTEFSTVVQVLMALSLNVAMTFSFQNIMAGEALGGLQWGNLMTSNTPGRLSFGVVMIIMIVDSFIYLLLTFYIEKINPGSVGVAQPWYFPFQRSFWCPNSSVQPVTNELTVNDDDIVQEGDPTDLPIGIKMTNLTKVFKRSTAVDNLTLNIYDDQITVLLGHNGAGKSTAMSMLTGNIKPTSGSAIVAGYDIALQLSSARVHMGFCPQHNILFRELTVHEHLEFFATLKGYSGDPLKQNINTLVEKLELSDKKNCRANALSGGQKRRLSVGIALCGDARVVLLDEPTSGMDPASRRALWELLQREKKGRSLILTTHFMDEADYLGDRVAIMAGGRLKCVGSPYFLKQHYGVGYTLVVVKENNFNEAICTKTIAKYIPGIVVKEDRGSEITYRFRNDHSNVFENVLNDLESNTASIGFRDYGLVATTLEDVFISVGSDMPPVDIDEMNGHANGDVYDDTVNHIQTNEQYFAKENLLTGSSMWIQQILTIWLKLLLIWSRSWGLVILQIVVPVSIISMNIIIISNVNNVNTDIRERPLTLNEGYPPTETWMQFNGTDTQSLGASSAEAFRTIFNEADRMSLRELNRPLDKVYLEEGSNSVVMARMRQSVIIGATFDEKSVTAWFSNFGFHDVAVSLATVHEAILRVFRPTATIKVSNHPIESDYGGQNHNLIMRAMISLQVATATANSLAIVSAVFIMFYVKERKSRAKLLQMAAGVEPALMWISNAVFDWLWFMIISFVFILTYVGFQVVGLSSGPDVGRLIVIFMLYGAAMLPFNYIFTHIFDKPSTAFSIKYFINIIFGIVGLSVIDAIEGENINVKIMDHIFMFIPLYAAVSAIRNIHLIGLTNWSCLQLCKANYDVEYCTPEVMCNLNPACCLRENPYFEWESPGVGRYMLAMAVSCLVFWAIHFLLEYRIIRRWFTRRRTPPPLYQPIMDADVIDEMQHAEQISKSAYRDHNLISKKLTKYYGGNLAVNQVSFSVSSGECFGLLGVNGAGKTSTFKMLMGDQSISHGDAFVRGHSVKTDMRKVHESLGYCPQFDAVFPEMTGRETLRMFAMLRGVKRDLVNPLSIHLADKFNFAQHLDKRVRQYSGGNKRKLSAAVSMMGYSKLMFLDEPTTGVDPAAKRQVWQAIRQATNAGRGVVLTSHSMEECEALCSRLTIMVNGQFRCLGSPQHLKNKFSQGFVLTIKMMTNHDVTTDENDQNLQALKDYIELKFDEPELKEEYKGLLSYYLKSTNMQWSQMFSVMEHAKREYNVEDYTISQTTLEQVFLQFTKYQNPIRSADTM